MFPTFDLDLDLDFRLPTTNHARTSMAHHQSIDFVTFESLGLDDLLDLLLNVFLDLLSSGGEGLVLLGLLPHEDAGDLNDTDDAKEEVDSGETVRKREKLVLGWVKESRAVILGGKERIGMDQLMDVEIVLVVVIVIGNGMT